MRSDDKTWLDMENAALIALIECCERPDTWSSLTNECLVEGSAVRVLEHRIDLYIMLCMSVSMCRLVSRAHYLKWRTCHLLNTRLG